MSLLQSHCLIKHSSLLSLCLHTASQDAGRFLFFKKGKQAILAFLPHDTAWLSHFMFSYRVGGGFMIVYPLHRFAFRFRVSPHVATVWDFKTGLVLYLYIWTSSHGNDYVMYIVIVFNASFSSNLVCLTSSYCEC